MARTFVERIFRLSTSDPKLLPGSHVMVEKFVVDDLQEATITSTVLNNFPFSSSSMIWGWRFLTKRKDGFEIQVGVVPRYRAIECQREIESQGFRFGGLGWVGEDKEEPIWLVSPPPPLTLRDVWKARRKECVAILVLFLCFQSGMGSIERHFRQQLNGMDQTIKKMKMLSDVSLRSGPPAIDIFVLLAEKIPNGVELISYEFDESRQSLLLKARSKNYAGVSSTVRNAMTLPFLRDIKANKARSLRQDTASPIEFLLEAKVI